MTTFDVLVVEDEPVVREAARKILLEENLSVAVATDASEALSIMEGAQCPLVLCDLMLPGASGFDLLRSIRARWPSTEVIVITGYATLDNAVTTFGSGAFDFVPKPFDIGELLGVVRRAMRSSKHSLDAEAAAVSSENASTASPEDGADLFLGRHSWAKLQADGSATVGVAETFACLLATIDRIELPAPGSHLRQGQLLARIVSPGEVVYRVWSPLSGTVLAANPRLPDTPDLIDRDPFGEGWLLQLIPDDLDRDVESLDRRRFRMAQNTNPTH